MEIKTFIAALLLPVFSNALNCFQCDPQDESCVLPKTGVTNTTDCANTFETTDPNAMLMTQTINKFSNNSTGEVQCYYLFFDIATDQKGVYRGCAKCNTSVTEFCDQLRQAMKDGDVKNCNFCQSDNCNDSEFDPKVPEFKKIKSSKPKSLIPPKEVIDRGSASSVTQSYKSMVILFINIVHFLYVIQA